MLAALVGTILHIMNDPLMENVTSDFMKSPLLEVFNTDWKSIPIS